MFFQRSFSPVLCIFLSAFIFALWRDVCLSQDRELLLDAICLVESGGDPNAVGDNGRSRGAYQCGEAAWIDSGFSEPYLPNVWDKAKSREVCRRYCQRYAGTDGTDESWARVWNGGPQGSTKKATEKYWQKVKNKMEELKKKRKKA